MSNSGCAGLLVAAALIGTVVWLGGLGVEAAGEGISRSLATKGLDDRESAFAEAVFSFDVTGHDPDEYDNAALTSIAEDGHRVCDALAVGPATGWTTAGSAVRDNRDSDEFISASLQYLCPKYSEAWYSLSPWIKIDDTTRCYDNTGLETCEQEPSFGVGVVDESWLSVNDSGIVLFSPPEWLNPETPNRLSGGDLYFVADMEEGLVG